MAAWVGPVAAAGISSGAGLLGGFLNRGRSQRDLMWDQAQVSEYLWDRQLRTGPEKEMEGLRRAGINPMLPYANGGSPAGAGGLAMPGIAAAVNPGQFLGPSTSSGISSAIDAFRSEATVKKTFAEISQIGAQIKNIEASTSLTQQQKINAVAEQRRIFADEVLKIGQSVLNSEQVKTLQSQRDLLESQTAINKWTELTEEARSQMVQAGIPLAQADQEFYETVYGQFLRWLERTKDAVNPFGGRGIGGGLPNR